MNSQKNLVKKWAESIQIMTLDIQMCSETKSIVINKTSNISDQTATKKNILLSIFLKNRVPYPSFANDNGVLKHKRVSFLNSCFLFI